MHGLLCTSRRAWSLPLALLALFPIILAAGDRVIGGPYAVRVTGRSATIGWIVQTGEVRVGSHPTGLTRAIPVLRSEKVSLTGLEPGQTVCYEAFKGRGGKGSFQTAPPAGATFDFVVFGDTRTRHELHRKVIDAILKEPPDFAVHTGDLVSDGYDTEQWPRFFEIEGALLRQMAFFPVLGNHERNNARFHEFFDVATPYYSFDWGSAHFTMLNTDLGNVALSPTAKEEFWQEQTRWMEQDLEKAQKAAFRFVVVHHPPFTAVKRRQADPHEIRGLVPLFEKHRVTALFGGHDHNYQRHTVKGVHYIVTGGGGAPLYAVDAPIDGVTQKVESTEHFVRVRVEGKKATLQAIALEGHLIDSLTLE